MPAAIAPKVAMHRPFSRPVGNHSTICRKKVAAYARANESATKESLVNHLTPFCSDLLYNPIARDSDTTPVAIRIPTIAIRKAQRRAPKVKAMPNATSAIIINIKSPGSLSIVSATPAAA